MATYRGIKGFNIQTLASDPAADTNTEGQVWYNTTTNVLKGVKTQIGTGAWASGNALPTARRNQGGIGTQTAALAVMGTPPASYPGVTTNVESYDGTNWTGAPSCNTARTNVGTTQIGTQTAGQIQGGYNGGAKSECEQFNGSSWTVKGALNTARWTGAGAGTQAAGLYAGGSTGGVTTAHEQWNGTAWSVSTGITTSRRYLAGGGSQTAALVFGGSPVTGATESWNGSSWSTLNPMSTARMYLAGICGATAQTASLAAGGVVPPNVAVVELFDGTNWSEQADLSSDRGQSSGNSAAPGTSGVISGGTPYMANTEEWTIGADTFAVKTFTSS